MMRLGATGNVLQEGSLYVLLFLLPFSKAAIEIAFVLMLAGWLTARLDPSTRSDTVWLRPALRPVAVAIGAYLAVCALSIVFSSYPALSLRAFFSKWTEYLLFTVMVADLGARPGVARRAVGVLAAAGLFVVVEAVTQELFGHGVFRHHALAVYERMTGPYENPIDLGTFLMVGIPVLLGYGATVTLRRTRLAVWFIVLLLVGCLARTLALGAWVGVALALAVLVWCGGRARRDALVVTALLILGAGGVFQSSRTPQAGQIISLSDIGTVDRMAMWEAALGMIRDRPILGQGLNTFMANYLEYWVGGQRMPRYAHNCYLQVAAETGLIGLLLFASLLGLLFTRLLAAVRARAFEHRVLLCGLMAGLLAFTVQAGVDTNFYALRQAVLFWVLAGLALGLSVTAGASVAHAPTR